MSKTNPTFIDIEPSDPRHRQVIAAAIKANDTDALTCLKNNTYKPIRVVFNAFMYLLMLTSWKGNDAAFIVIYGVEARKTVAKLASLHQGEENNYQLTIPLDTYDFLL